MNDDELNNLEEPAVKYLPIMSPQEFLAWEDKQELRHEYIEGEIITMEGGSMQSAHLLTNIFREISAFLKDKSCNIYVEHLRIAPLSAQSYFYPDITIFCEKAEEIGHAKLTYKNPSVIIEILSPSTRDYDMGRKQFYYMQIGSMKEYIMIDSQKIDIRIARRQPNNSWKYEFLYSVNDVLLIETIGLSVDVSEIYNEIELKK